MLFKVDFEKAYDMVNWNFLDSVMGQMGFPDIWRTWIRNCVSSTRASVLINGSPTGEFVASRGLRQGDPLSPFLFSIVMEALSVSIRMASGSGLFNGIRLPNGGIVITHCMYADDTLFLGDWSVQNGKNLARILKCFHMASGLKINFFKSSMIGIGTTAVEEDLMINVLQCKRGKLPFQHLGVPVGENLNRIKSWDPVIDKFKGKLSSWKARTLSFGGRLTLVKSVLGSLPIYFMSLFKMPSAVVRKLEGLRRDFLWGGGSDKRSIPWVKWESVMAPREVGGLGIGSIRDLNIALLTKWKWSFKVNSSALWVNVIKAVHWQPRKHAQFPSNKVFGSAWNNIISIEEVLKAENIDINKLLKTTVGNNSSVLFWWDWWIGPSPLKEMFPNLFMLEKHKMCKVTEKMVSHERDNDWRWEWVRSLAPGIETLQLQQCLQLLQGFVSADGPDEWRWEANDDGLFSVKSLRHILELNRTPVDLNPVIWSKWIPLKVRCFAWKVRLNKIPVKTALARRGVQVGSEECSMCFNHLETSNHVLLHCAFAAKVWYKVFEWCGLFGALGDDIRDRIDCHNIMIGSENMKEKVAVIVMASVWFIWLARNDFIFNSCPLNVDGVMEKIRVYTYLWLKYRANRLDVMWHRWFDRPLS
ncbi:hypothetical protein QVD17_25805 [Tagetes erecta]|uniref:Reverse transcriptase domain-containing protein n=1 Tax=Tagetes erecta TaxID=13708 RepID=A0AAD8K5B1_TARER|nr:hypothetical protein QVD17_25805 [Tagetes erecta]